MKVAGYFDLEGVRAREIAADVGKAVTKTAQRSSAARLKEREINRMTSAFENEELKLALRGGRMKRTIFGTGVFAHSPMWCRVVNSDNTKQKETGVGKV